MGALGGLAAITALPAYANVVTNNYTIGSPSGTVTNVTVSPTSGVASVANSSYTVTFVSPAALSYSVPDTITIGDSTAGNSVASSAVLASVDVISGSCLQTGDDSSGAFGVKITLTSTACAIPAGATVEVTFNATNPTANFNFTVVTSENGTAANSPTVTITSAPPTLTPASQVAGANTTYTIGQLGATNATGGSWATITVSATTLELNASLAGVKWYNGTAGYAVTYTPSGGSAAADAVTAVNIGTPNGGTAVSGNPVFLTLTTAVASGGIVSITAEVTNPLTGTTTVTVTPGTVSGATFTPESNAETTGSTTFGSSVSAATVSVSPLVASATATYTVAFKATTQDVGGGITISETTGPTNFTGANTLSGGILVNDTTAGWHYVVPTGNATVSGGGDTILVPFTGNTINAGDTVTTTLVDVTNPGAGTYSDLDVSTSVDTVPVAAPPYTISVSGTAGVNVTVIPPTTGAVATYTISNLYATAAFTGGLVTNFIELTAPAGTVFPDNGSNFSVMDTTTSTGSGTFTLLHYNAANDVVLVPPNNITSGDLLTITASDVINPSSSSSTDTITLSGAVSGQTGVAPFPHANLTYPNGSIVNWNGTDYVFAGGHPFGIATPTLLLKLQTVDHATVIKAAAGSTLPTTLARPGTLITTNTINANATIYYVGTDGQLHGFATGPQFTGNGYDPALTVTVPTLGGMTVGATAGAAGTAATAFANTADGAIVDSSGTYYVLDGGRAFGIPTQAWLTTVRKYDLATPLTGAVGSVLTSAAFATGALITVNGEVYVGYVGDAFPFKSQTQFITDGYSGTASITAPSLNGLAVVAIYSSS